MPLQSDAEVAASAVRPGLTHPQGPGAASRETMALKGGTTVRAWPGDMVPATASRSLCPDLVRTGRVESSKGYRLPRVPTFHFSLPPSNSRLGEMKCCPVSLTERARDVPRQAWTPCLPGRRWPSLCPPQSWQARAICRRLAWCVGCLCGPGPRSAQGLAQEALRPGQAAKTEAVLQASKTRPVSRAGIYGPGPFAHNNLALEVL